MSVKTPRGSRLVIALTGRRNTGKSSLINALIGEEVAIVSEVAGTTTDPVVKTYELIPVGPVTFYDTAGIDDVGEIGKKRVSATKKILWRTDVAIVVIDEKGITYEDKNFIKNIADLKIPFVVVFNKADISEPSSNDIVFCNKQKIPHISVSASSGKNIDELREKLISVTPKEFTEEKPLASDLFEKGDTVVCVTPIDLSAPKGRLILPQVQIIREILDGNAIGVILKETELEQGLANLKNKPALVITDSQAIGKVSEIVSKDINLTTFSVLYARYKGDIETLVEGARAVDSLKDGDKVLIGEACSHHVQEDDIGRVKIPKWIKKYTGKNITFDVFSGHDFPESLEEYSLVIHCGACMLNQMEMMHRINECKRRSVPIANYGVIISKLHGVLDRVVSSLF